MGEINDQWKNSGSVSSKRQLSVLFSIWSISLGLADLLGLVLICINNDIRYGKMVRIDKG